MLNAKAPFNLVKDKVLYKQYKNTVKDLVIECDTTKKYNSTKKNSMLRLKYEQSVLTRSSSFLINEYGLQNICQSLFCILTNVVSVVRTDGKGISKS